MTTQVNDSIKELEKLKEKLDTGQMSVIIGAGFSRNASDLFPLWTDLLEDLVLDLYGTKIDMEYSEKFLLIEEFGTLINFRAKKVNEYIKDIGYLNLVEQYIEKHGYREVVTSYIEERTPQVKSEGDKKYLYLKKTDKEVELTDNDLLLHKKMINLPWNNIYTTNYDELLEIPINNSFKGNINKEISDSEHQIFKYDFDILKFTEKHSTILKRLSELNRFKESELNFNESSVNSLSLDNVRIETFSNETKQQNFNELKRKTCKELEIVIEDESKCQIGIDDLISKCKAKLDEIEQSKEAIEINKSKTLSEIDWLKKLSKNSFNLVTKASELSVSKNKNIVKLHGSLRKNDVEYGFDGDITTQYIFAKSDYESYPEKHEAFTQLMRISLLQESFCLIGFSGDDPNFLEWVKWVRDVLKSSKNKDSKIYFISTGKDDFTSSKKLFFENHNIYPIFLGDVDVETHLLSGYDNMLGFKGRKKSIDTFLHFLDTNLVDTIRLNKSHLTNLEYENIWRNLDLALFNTSEKINNQRIIEYLTPLKKIDKKVVLSLRNTNSEFIKIRFINYVQDVIDKGEIEETQWCDLGMFALMAIRDLNLSISTFFNDNVLNKIENVISNESLFVDLKNKEILLLNNEEKFRCLKNENNSYYNILKNLFVFNYDEASKLISNWVPNDFLFKIKKACLLSYFDQKKSLKYLKSIKPIMLYEDLDDILLYNQVSRFFELLEGYDVDRQKKSSELIQALKNKGFVSIYDFVDSYVKSFEKKSNKIEAYGANRFQHNSSTIWETIKITDKGISYAFLSSIGSIGIPLTNGASIFIDKTEWYKFFSHLFQDYSYPCLFYSLQYTDEKFIRRIAQDYMYDDSLADFVNTIVPKLLNIYNKELSNPNLRKSILLFCAEIFVSVKPKVWNELELTIIRNDKFFEHAFDDWRNEEFLFLKSIIKYSNSKSCFTTIFEQCLKQKKISKEVIDIMLFLKGKKFIYQGKSSDVWNKIDSIINNKGTYENYWFLIYCLYPILSNSQKNNVFNNKNLSSIKGWDDINVVYYFVTKEKQFSLKSLKVMILNSSLLFKSGAEEKQYGPSMNFIRLSKLHKIKWTNKEKDQIYKELLSEWKKVKPWLKREDDITFNISKELIKEMYLFLLTYNKFDEEIFNEISKLHFKYEGYINLSDTFISYNEKGVVNGLRALYKRLSSADWESENKMLINIILNNILMFKKERLEESINFLKAVIEDKSGNVFLKENQLIIEAILRKYYKELPSEVDKIYIILHMVKIAKGYKKLFGSNDIVEDWLKIGKTTRFNMNYINL
ncbi:SIR2 family protein [Myroides sp. C15-4]|uniref:SIR2 family protein n=1 Tax=Myroides sp. C15-4 TaxID=3400532 RepID=UPI003D2F930A